MGAATERIETELEELQGLKDLAARLDRRALARREAALARELVEAGRVERENREATERAYAEAVATYEGARGARLAAAGDYADATDAERDARDAVEDAYRRLSKFGEPAPRPETASVLASRSGNDGWRVRQALDRAQAAFKTPF